jgi:hypothetical protein
VFNKYGLISFRDFRPRIIIIIFGARIIILVFLNFFYVINKISAITTNPTRNRSVVSSLSSLSPLSVSHGFLLLFLLVSCSLLPHLSISESDSYISAAISTKGLSFAKDLLISQAVDPFVSIRIPDIEKSVRIPFVGEVHMAVSNVIIEAVNISASDSTAAAGEVRDCDCGFWFVTVSDEGFASVQVNFYIYFFRKKNYWLYGDHLNPICTLAFINFMLV